MPLFNAMLGRGQQWAAMVRRMMGGSVIDQIAPELAFQVDLESASPEFWFLQGGQLRWGAFNVAAGGAGFRSMAILRNPAGSGLMYRVEQVTVEAAAAGDILLSLNQTLTAGTTDTNNAVTRDTRQNGLALSGRLFTKNSAAAPGFSSGWRFLPPSTVQLDLIMTPGWEFFICPNQDNQVIAGAVAWRERPLFEQELG